MLDKSSSSQPSLASNDFLTSWLMFVRLHSQASHADSSASSSADPFTMNL